MEIREYSGSSSALLDPTDSGFVHMVERDVRRRLMASEDLTFQSLVVHRVPDGVCLEGVVERPQTCVEAMIESIVRELEGVGVVHNHLVVQESTRPQKG